MNKKIAIIDDDQNICRFLSESLKLKGYRVATFDSGERGLEALQDGGYHLALLDILLPDGSGLDLCRTLREDPRTARLPVVLMTAFYRDAEHIQQARDEYGATDFLSKPFNLNTLHGKVAELIGAAAGQEAQEAFQIEGDLAVTPFPNLLHNLYTLRQTGLLHLERGAVKKVIYLKDGYPIFVRSNLVRECLGKLLVRDGLISEAQCEESLQRSKTSGRLQGTELIEMQLLTPERLHDFLARQVTEKLLETFAWPDGRYRFLQAREFRKGLTAIELSPAALILQGLRRHCSERWVTELLAPHRQRYLVQSPNPHYRFQDMRLTRREAEVLGRCRGELPLEDLVAQYPLSRQDVESLLAALLIAEIIESRETPATTDYQGEANDPGPIAREQVRKTILEDYSRMMGQNYFALFGIKKGAGNEEIKQSYFALAKQYHPDRFLQENLSADLKAKVNELFQRVGEAYRVLSDPRSRREYGDSLAGRKTSGERDVTDILQAETDYQKGLSLLRASNFSDALEAFSRAIQVNPREPEYLTHYAWCRFKSNPASPEARQEAMKTLQQSLDLNARIDKTHLYLGYLLKQEDREREAEKRFEIALKCNPHCTEALRELRLMNMRRPQEKTGLFSKVFRK